MSEENESVQVKEEKVSFAPKTEKKEKKEKTAEDHFRNGMLALVGIIIAIATLQLYFSVDEIIYTWFEYQYRPIFRSVYYLTVIIAGLFVLNRFFLKKEKK
ncbi:hypothetical protein [Methanolobus bombayensis]|uniref:hypothetical protein n=1 Tax=Methanolobus bombayensis TaxID=38023 RepID=UPI001AE3AF2B|nr:hypothetical protein [Methanolobus bombayensis]MBP1909673.1 hypothetical protein [Methanolobus bombayensis]